MALPSDIILFDGVCNLCNSLVRFVIRHDRRKRISFAPLQSNEGRYLLNMSGLTRNIPDTVVFISRGKVFIKSSAILRLVRRMGGFWILLYGFVIIPRFIRDYLYDLIARSRYRIFGKKDVCMVPTPEIKERFIDESRLAN